MLAQIDKHLSSARQYQLKIHWLLACVDWTFVQCPSVLAEHMFSACLCWLMHCSVPLKISFIGNFKVGIHNVWYCTECVSCICYIPHLQPSELPSTVWYCTGYVSSICCILHLQPSVLPSTVWFCTGYVSGILYILHLQPSPSCLVIDHSAVNIRRISEQLSFIFA